MSLQELRAQIIEDVQALTDEAALQEVLDTLHCFPPFAKEEPDLYQPTSEQLAAIQRGLDDVRAGRVVSHEEIMRETKAWLDTQ